MKVRDEPPSSRTSLAEVVLAHLEALRGRRVFTLFVHEGDLCVDEIVVRRSQPSSKVLPEHFPCRFPSSSLSNIRLSSSTSWYIGTVVLVPPLYWLRLMRGSAWHRLKVGHGVLPWVVHDRAS